MYIQVYTLYEYIRNDLYVFSTNVTIVGSFDSIYIVLPKIQSQIWENTTVKNLLLQNENIKFFMSIRGIGVKTKDSEINGCQMTSHFYNLFVEDSKFGV